LAFLAKYPMFLEGRSNPFISYVAECTISNHFALVDYSFLVVNRFGNSNLLRKTLLLMNQHQISHNSKLITNSLLQFQGDVQTLKDLLSKDLKKYMDCYCVACIDYFGYQKLDVTSILLTFFQDSKKDKEIHLACIRYFSQVKFKPVVPFLYEFLKNDVNSWECAAIAAKALGNYPSKETNNHLLEALGSYSWYVRNNAAESIVKNNRKDVVKEMLRQISDKYAHEALKYQLQLQEKGC
ncbi:MAG: HEAT repeat domain-containing protein, partial [Bacilli bacterium]|nr:HEAT repeat domain-containing protein [Bacilli bacterium]